VTLYSRAQQFRKNPFYEFVSGRLSAAEQTMLLPSSVSTEVRDNRDLERGFERIIDDYESGSREVRRNPFYWNPFGGYDSDDNVSLPNPQPEPRQPPALTRSLLSFRAQIPTGNYIHSFETLSSTARAAISVRARDPSRTFPPPPHPPSLTLPSARSRAALPRRPDWEPLPPELRAGYDADGHPHEVLHEVLVEAPRLRGVRLEA
jgi:hypothetical protein